MQITGLKSPATTDGPIGTANLTALKTQASTTPYRPPGPPPGSGLHRYCKGHIFHTTPISPHLIYYMHSLRLFTIPGTCRRFILDSARLKGIWSGFGRSTELERVRFWKTVWVEACRSQLLYCKIGGCMTMTKVSEMQTRTREAAVLYCICII